MKPKLIITKGSKRILLSDEDHLINITSILNKIKDQVDKKETIWISSFEPDILIISISAEWQDEDLAAKYDPKLKKTVFLNDFRNLNETI
jgi:hypothetical protein